MGLTNIWLSAVRCYTYDTPITRGRHVAYLTALKFVAKLPESMPAVARDGRKFDVDLSTGMQTTVFFLGEYEKPVTDIFEETIKAKQSSKQGLTFLDVGANFGWYTTLFAKYAKQGGVVHSFEPVPKIFENLKRNVDLLDDPSIVRINNLALGEEEAELTINLFEGLSTGHASLSTQGRDDAIPFKCRVVTLDSYLEEYSVGDVDIVKVDIEGAELSFLKGADRLFAQKTPPVFLMEMALNQAKNFGYKPNDLIEYIRSKAEYVFFKIDEVNRKLIQIDGFAADDIGANVLCFPKAEHDLDEMYQKMMKSNF